MKKICAGICAVALAVSLNAAVFGLERPVESNETVIARDLSAPSDKSRAAKGKFGINKEKWDALSDIQKEEVYRLKEVSIDVECQIIEKYMEYGVLDRETGASIKLKMGEFKNGMRKNGKIPGFYEKSDREKKDR